MKTLFLVRHAKSSWDNSELSDHDRPLSKRGKRDAPFMGKLLNQKHIKPDIIITSSAKRAYSTAKNFVKELNYKKGKLVVDKNIYESGTSELINIIKKIDDKHNSVMLFGHNPALTMLNNYLSDKSIDNIPTCAVVTIEFDVDSWGKISSGSGKQVFFEYPKKHFK